jgi:hypothetical protein
LLILQWIVLNGCDGHVDCTKKIRTETFSLLLVPARSLNDVGAYGGPENQIPHL